MAPRGPNRTSRQIEKLLDQILMDIARGVRVKPACEAAGMDDSDFWRLMIQRDDVYTRYVRAQKITAEIEAEDLLEIADSAHPEEIAKAKLRIDTRQWRLERLNRKRWGKSVAVDVSLDERRSDDEIIGEMRRIEESLGVSVVDQMIAAAAGLDDATLH